MKKIEKFLNPIALFCAIFSMVVSFLNSRYAEANAWMCATIWILLSMNNERMKEKYKEKTEIIEELTTTVKDNEELGKMVRELHS